LIASVCQLRPESRGFVRIKSADPRSPPAIQPRYLSSRFDRDTIVAGMKLLRRIMNCMRPWRAILFQSLCEQTSCSKFTPAFRW
jgi:choline dehydrogenase-like flavoprotein